MFEATKERPQDRPFSQSNRYEYAVEVVEYLSFPRPFCRIWASARELTCRISNQDQRSSQRLSRTLRVIFLSEERFVCGWSRVWVGTLPNEIIAYGAGQNGNSLLPSRISTSRLKRHIHVHLFEHTRKSTWQLENVDAQAYSLTLGPDYPLQNNSRPPLQQSHCHPKQLEASSTLTTNSSKHVKELPMPAMKLWLVK